MDAGCCDIAVRCGQSIRRLGTKERARGKLAGEALHHRPQQKLLILISGLPARNKLLLINFNIWFSVKLERVEGE